MSFSKPLISVVIPTNNKADMIEKSILSVLQQSYKLFELIIIDEASDDGTENKVRKIKDHRIKYVKLPENTNGTRAKNLGIRMSNGEFIAFLESGDVWLPDKLEKQLAFILNSGESITNAVCFTGMLIDNEQMQVKKKNKPYFKEKDIMNYIFLENNIVHISTIIVSSLLAKATLFDPLLRRHQDVDFCLRLRNNDADFYYFNECLTTWNFYNRGGRISLNKNDENLSLEWLSSRKDQLSLSSQWAFEVFITVESLVLNRKLGEALEVASKAFLHRQINLSIFRKILASILSTDHLHLKVNYLLS